METRELQMTLFQVDVLKSKVGEGTSMAYQIITSPGELLGRLGTLVGAPLPSSNDIDFSANEPPETKAEITSWIGRLLTRFSR